MRTKEDYARLFENYENVNEPMECKCIGTPPEWLSGTMLRNGPGMFTIGDSEYKHWFDGLAYIQRYHFKDGKMSYSAKFLDSEVYRRCMAANRIVCTQFGTSAYSDPCKSLFSRFFSFFSPDELPADNCLVAFAQSGDGVYALTETHKMVRIDTDTLAPIATVDLQKFYAVNMATAHHQGDYKGNTYNIGSKFGKVSEYVFTKTPVPKTPNGTIDEIQLLGSLPVTDARHPAYYHSFGMSENFFVLFESPVRVSLMKLLVRQQMNYSFHDCMLWDEAAKVTHVRLLDKRTGKAHPVKLTSDTFFTFHHANTYEKDGFLVADYCSMKNPGKFESFEMHNMKSGQFQIATEESTPYLHRMIIPLTVPEGTKPGDDLLKNCSFRGRCSAVLREDGSIHMMDMRISETTMEFPRYNYEHKNMRDYQYVYGSSILSLEAANDWKSQPGVVKVDVRSGETTVLKRETEYVEYGEPIFMPAPDATKEDDGILVVPVMNLKEGENPYILILSASDLSELARYIIPQACIPAGFHGIMCSNE